MFKWLDSILFTLRVAWYAITKPPKRIEPKRPDPDDSVLRVRPLEGAIVFRPDGLEIVIPDLEACEELACIDIQIQLIAELMMTMEIPTA